MSDGIADLTRFARALRDEGLAVGPGRVVRFCQAAALLQPVDLYWAGRATLIGHPRDIPTYDAVFGAFFSGVSARATGGTRVQVTGAIERDVEIGLASSVELLRDKNFAYCSPDELAELMASMARLPPLVPLRRSRRREAGRRGALELRRTLRRSFRTGGEPLERAWRERRRRPRRLVLLLDVSGSMADYSRALVMFAHVVLRTGPRWEAFCFGTRLTRLTRALAITDPDEALRRAAAEAFDWGGGTRIGESLKRFLDEFGHRGLARGAVVVICSDGLEVGDPDVLEAQMARLARLAHRVVWLNPLKGDPAYEPLARGMQAALPHIDTFAAGHNLASLEAVAAALAPAPRS
jgi:uncharacterized protein with von Willebrand factor type A (vWA) domain